MGRLQREIRPGRSRIFGRAVFHAMFAGFGSLGAIFYSKKARNGVLRVNFGAVAAGTPCCDCAVQSERLYRTPGGARMEKIIRCCRYAIAPSSVQRFGDRESRLDSAKTLERLSGRAPLRRTRDPMTQTRSIMGFIAFFREEGVGEQSL
jgi:hypothetical protein